MNISPIFQRYLRDSVHESVRLQPGADVALPVRRDPGGRHGVGADEVAGLLGAALRAPHAAEHGAQLGGVGTPDTPAGEVFRLVWKKTQLIITKLTITLAESHTLS